MTTDELKKEAEEWLNKWELCNKCQNKVDCVSNFSYCKKVAFKSYLASAEPREKEIKSLGERCLQLQKDKGNLTDRVNNLEEKLANADYQLEGRDLEIKELKAQLESERDLPAIAYMQGAEKQKKKNTDQLTKAKDLFLRFIDLKNKPCASGHSINMLLYENICAEAEQFIKDSEGK